MRSLRTTNWPSNTRLVDDFFLDFDRMFDGFFDRTPSAAQALMKGPAVDIEEMDNGYLLQVDLPGFSKSDVEIKIEDSVLKLTGERKFESQKSENGYSRRERQFGRFERAFRLPENINEEGIEASFKNGVLSIFIAKQTVVKAQKTIEIREDEQGFFSKLLGSKAETEKH